MNFPLASEEKYFDASALAVLSLQPQSIPNRSEEWGQFNFNSYRPPCDEEPLHQPRKSYHMAFIEQVIEKTRRIEQALIDLGASGRGVHEKVNSIQTALPVPLVNRLRFIASVRNKLMHEDGYKFDGDESAFLTICETVIDELENINKIAAKAVQDEASSAKRSGESDPFSPPLADRRYDFNTGEDLSTSGEESKPIVTDRRAFLALLLCSTPIGLFIRYKVNRHHHHPKPPPIARAAPFVKPKDTWSGNQMHDFLVALPRSTMLSLKKSLQLLQPVDSKNALSGGEQDALDVQKYALWVSSNIFAYPFRSETELDYHDLVKWVCSKTGVPSDIVDTAPTFMLERKLAELVFAQLWETLTEQQRKELLDKIDPNGTIKDKAAIAALGGAGAIAALSATVAFAGFAFYTTMSVTIATVAGLAGVTLPFAAYTGASAIVGILSGPFGWAVMGVTALGGAALAGRANVKKSAFLISQLHSLKVEALAAAGVADDQVFTK